MPEPDKPVLQTVAEVITAAGGSTKVARKFGVDVRVVSNWKRDDRGFPPETYAAWQGILAELGKTAPDSLWRQREVVG